MGVVAVSRLDCTVSYLVLFFVWYRSTSQSDVADTSEQEASKDDAQSKVNKCLLSLFETVSEQKVTYLY